MLDYPKALRSAGVSLFLAGGVFLVIAYMFSLGSYGASFWAFLLLGVGALLAVFLMFRGLLKRRPHITYASLHALGAMVGIAVPLFAHMPWLLISPLIWSILLFVFLQPILMLLSNIQIVVHSGAPKGTTQDAPAYEQMYQTMPAEFVPPGEMSQKTDFGRYYPKD